MRKGENKKAFAYYEVIPHLKVDEFACPAYLYKRFDTEKVGNPVSDIVDSYYIMKVGNAISV